ncbi:MAG: hypothetical protein V1729_00785 [Candidatus Woesearchaeota archaeon]
MPIENTTEIAEGSGRLLQITAKAPRSHNGSFWFSDNNVRKTIGTIFEEGASYTFMRTVVNPEAADTIRANSRELGKIRMGRYDDEFSERFDAGLMEVYMAALCHTIGQSRIRHATYPIIETRGVHSLDSHPDQPQWPQVHVIDSRTGDAYDFANLVNQLNGDRAYEFIKEKEQPQNYRMGAINLLRAEGIAPLKLEERIWTVDSEMLRNAADFLLPSSYNHESRSCGFDDD